MINTDKRRKLIDGLVIAMGPAKAAAKKPSGAKAYGDEPEEPEETDAPVEGDESEDEGVKCARDAARALGMPELSTQKAKSFAEAIRTIAAGYEK